MEAKIFEVRDKGTFIPVLAIQMGSDDDQERWLMSRAGYGTSHETQKEYVILVKIDGGEPLQAHLGPFSWGRCPRTYHVAHEFIQRNFDTLKPGAVVDVEFLLSERKAPKVSERAYAWNRWSVTCHS